MDTLDYWQLALEWLSVPAFFYVAFCIARGLRPVEQRKAPVGERAADPVVSAERCSTCGAWQARHLARDECWQCGASLAVVVSAQPGSES